MQEITIRNKYNVIIKQYYCSYGIWNKGDSRDEKDMVERKCSI
jgi:hypothetical protein